MKFVFRPMGSVDEVLFSKHALLRSLWADPRLQPVVAHKLLPYLELLIKGLISPGVAAKKEGFSYLLSRVATAHPAEEASSLGSAPPPTWHLRHYQSVGWAGI